VVDLNVVFCSVSASARAAESAANARSELLAHTAAVTAAAESSVKEMKVYLAATTWFF
jgi:hypothetical protein